MNEEKKAIYRGSERVFLRSLYLGIPLAFLNDFYGIIYREGEEIMEKLVESVTQVEVKANQALTEISKARERFLVGLSKAPN
jgi:hypothetical protein